MARRRQPTNSVFDISFERFTRRAARLSLGAPFHAAVAKPSLTLACVRSTAVADPPRRAAALPSAAALDALTRRLAAGAAAIDRSAAFPFDNLAALHAHGLIGAVVPVEAGGAGASLAEAQRIVGAVGRGEPSTALVPTMTYLVHRAISRPGSRWDPRLRDAVWRSAVEEGGLANNLRVEPEFGSPARGRLPATVARRSADGWRLSGHKLYATGIPALHWLAVLARTDEPEPQLGVFLVPQRPGIPTPGLRVVESWDPLGLRASASHEAIFDGVCVPLDHAVDVRPLGDLGGLSLVLRQAQDERKGRGAPS